VEISLGMIFLTLMAEALLVPLVPLGVKLLITSILIMLTGLAFVGVNIPQSPSFRKTLLTGLGAGFLVTYGLW